MISRLLFLFLAFTSIQLSAKIDTLYVYSVEMNKDLPNLVILPEGTDNLSDDLPIVYLLHGAGGNFDNWYRRFPEIQNLSNEYNCIVVCPDGGKTSWYIDSPIDQKMKYESYIINHLIPEVDSIYPTLNSPSFRAITGLSMGGHGALFLAIRHPETFSFAGSMSGGVDLRPFENNWGLTDLLGNASEFPNHWEEHSVVAIIEEIKTDQKFIIDCGLDDFFLDVNRDLHRVMNEQGISHEYSERSGAHNWEYWRVSVIEHFLFFSSHFEK
jgi:S-formylglutathione hydrolase FrmB